MKVKKVYVERKRNKDENVHRFALSAKRGKLLEREREREERGNIILGYYTRVTYYHSHLSTNLNKNF